VPSVSGMTQSQAQAALQSVNLLLGTVTCEFDNTIAAGLILRQSPVTGTMVASGSAVAIVLSAGPQTTTVPDLTGKTQAEAQTALVASGLTLGNVSTEHSDTVAEGQIIRQTPLSGTTAISGSAVAVVLSQGPQNVSVPGVVGMNQTAAQYKLIAAGLTLGTVTSEYSSTVASGLVISQSPASGAVEPPGTMVNLVVSKGSSAVSVPNVSGMTQTTAQGTLETAGLALGSVTHEYSDTVEAGLVVRQTPEAASTAAAGTPVSIVISDGPTPSGCFGGTAKELRSGPGNGSGFLLGAVLTLLLVVLRPKVGEAPSLF